MRTNYDIVGYDYRAQRWCTECMREVAIEQALALGSATSWGDAGTAEQALGEWASLAGINRQEEDTYDQGEFPKVILHYQTECTEEDCDQCGESLIPD